MDPTSRLVPTNDRPRACAALTLLAALLAALLTSGVARADNVDLPRFPSISPDGQKVVFSWRGDLWKVSAAGGRAVRLTSHSANELSSAWSPDGTQIAFESDRDGYRNIWIVRPDGTDLRPVTALDRSVDLSGFGRGPDGEPAIFFAATLEGDLYRSARPYSVALEGGQPRRVHDAFGTFPVSDADGSRVLFERGGSSWMRRHYRGPDNRDVWLFDVASGEFRQLTTFDGNDGQARFGGDRTVLFLSDRELDAVNLYRMSAFDGESTLVRLTDFDDVDVVGFDVSADGSTAILHVWDALFRLDLRQPGAVAERLAITAAEDRHDTEELRQIGRSVSQAAISPDGKTLAVIAYGDVYIRAMEEQAPTRAITRTEARATDLAWSPDGVRLYFVIDEDGIEEIRAATVRTTRREVREETRRRLSSGDSGEQASDAEAESDADATTDAVPESSDDDAASAEESDSPEGDDERTDLDPSRWSDAVAFHVETVVTDPAGVHGPRPSPDGTRLAYRRGLGDLVVLDLLDGETRTLVEGWDTSLDWRWSPDGRRIAYQQNDRNFSRDIHIIDLHGDAPAINITRHPDNDSSPRWSADGRMLAFLSQRVNDENDVWVVALDPSLEVMTPLEREAYYRDNIASARRRKPIDPVDLSKPRGDDEDATTASEVEFQLELDNAYRRLRRITRMPGNEWNLEFTPAGDRFVFTGSDAGGGLLSVKWDGSDQKRLTGTVSVQHLTTTGDRVVFVTGGRVGSVKVDGGDLKYHDVAARVRIDLKELSSRKFLELARTLGARFYHPTMKGLDWQALTERHHELALSARTSDEFNFVANRFLGELNGSHLGVNAPSPSAPLREAKGRLGTDHTPVDDGYRIDFVLPNSPAALSMPPLEVGDVIVALDFEPIAPPETIEERLSGRIGDEVAVMVRRALIDADEPDADPNEVELAVFMTPVSWGAMRQLRYEWTQARSRALVADWSDGRLGYIHIAGMNQPSLDEFERDLFAAADGRDGLIIDVRNNGGGWTADRLLSSIMVRPHAYTLPRGMDPSITDGYPQDRLFIQRYVLPINMLCNEKSFSNAEIVAHAFKTLERGTLVGNQTYGGVISTGRFTLIDGTTVRMPFRGWYLPDGTDMENNGAIPDIIIPQTPESEVADEDAQLRAAVDDLLQRMDP